MESIGHLIHDYGLIVVAVCIFVEGVGIPLPGETALIIASVMSGTHHTLNIVEVILTAAAAAAVGRTIGYSIGWEYGYRMLLRYGPYVGITEARIKLGEYLFLRHGGKIIIVAQFVPILRTIAGILAGANRMPRPQFLLANIVGAALWATVFGIAAYTFGRQIERLAGSMLIVLGIGAVIFLFLFANFIKRHEEQLVAEAERAIPGPLK
jgi:membrane protein DedA with SNARE-associated domain